MVGFFEIPKDKMLTVGDMVDELKKQGFPDTKAIDRKDVDGKHYVEFIVRKGKWTVGRKLYEYNIGSLSMIQQNRRYFLEEIVETFRKHEKEEREALRLPIDIRDLYPGTMYVSDIIQNIINQKEKENKMKPITWKVSNITIERSTKDISDSTIRAELVGCPTLDRFNCVDIHNALQAQLDAQIVAPNLAWPKKNPYVIDTDNVYEYMLKDIKLARACRDAVNRRFGVNKIPAIEKVIFNAPATIVFWKDGSDKTVVKTQNGEAYDPEKGLAMAITKKALGNEGKYFNEIKKWTAEESVRKTFSDLTEGIANYGAKLAARDARNTLGAVLDNKKATKAELIEAIERAQRYLNKGLDT